MSVFQAALCIFILAGCAYFAFVTVVSVRTYIKTNKGVRLILVSMLALHLLAIATVGVDDLISRVFLLSVAFIAFVYIGMRGLIEAKECNIDTRTWLTPCIFGAFGSAIGLAISAGLLAIRATQS